MILADTSIWIRHFREGEPKLSALLADGVIAMHPFILGELACGSLKSRAEVLAHMKTLPPLPMADDEEVLYLIDHHRLMAKGLGYIDMHLLSAVKMNAFRLWTIDRRLAAAADGLGIGYA